jgi:hypothetical protein
LLPFDSKSFNFPISLQIPNFTSSFLWEGAFSFTRNIYLVVYDNSVLQNIFGSTRQKAIEEWIKLLEYSSPNITKINSRRRRLDSMHGGE